MSTLLRNISDAVVSQRVSSIHTLAVQYAEMTMPWGAFVLRVNESYEMYTPPFNPQAVESFLDQYEEDPLPKEWPKVSQTVPNLGVLTRMGLTQWAIKGATDVVFYNRHTGAFLVILSDPAWRLNAISLMDNECEAIYCLPGVGITRFMFCAPLNQFYVYDKRDTVMYAIERQAACVSNPTTRH